MFYFERNKSLAGGAFTTLELIYHAVVRSIRSQRSNAVLAVIINIVQILALVTVFYLIMTMIGRVTGIAKIRGNSVLFLLSGVFLFMTHVKTVSGVMGDFDWKQPNDVAFTNEHDGIAFGSRVRDALYAVGVYPGDPVCLSCRG